MKFRVTVTYEYNVNMATAAEYYGTTDPEQMAEVDRQSIQEDPEIIGADLTNGYTVTVTPVKE